MIPIRWAALGARSTLRPGALRAALAGSLRGLSNPINAQESRLGRENAVETSHVKNSVYETDVGRSSCLS